jgi:hypothetical protein
MFHDGKSHGNRICHFSSFSHLYVDVKELVKPDKRYDKSIVQDLLLCLSGALNLRLSLCQS